MQKCAFRLDDVTPDMDWEHFEAAEALFEKYHLYPLLGIVPDNRDLHLKAGECRKDFWELMRTLKKRGYTIAQHGYRHVYETTDAGLLGINPFSEFAGLPYAKQREKLEQGKKILQEQQLETDIFMAPGHSYDKNTLRALTECGFRIVTDGYSKRPYKRMGLSFIPSRLSGPGKIQGIDTICLHLNSMELCQIAQMEQFILQNKASLCSYRELLAAVLVQKRTVMVALQEKKNLWMRRVKNYAAANGALQKYFARTDAGTKGKKLWKRTVMLPLAVHDVLLELWRKGGHG